MSLSNDPLANLLGGFVDLPVEMHGYPPTITVRRGMIGSFFPVTADFEDPTASRLLIFGRMYKVLLSPLALLDAANQ